MSLDPLLCATFLLLAFLVAGAVQSCWLRSSWSARFQVPLDLGRTLGGKRIFGENKTWRGFLGMVPAAGLAFVGWRVVFASLSPGLERALWPLSPGAYGLLGCWVGFGFMAGELPNSFIKRRLGIAPGAAPAGGWARVVCFALDRCDSILGGLVALALVVPVPPSTVACVMVIGVGLHWSFSLLLFKLGVKERPA